MIKIIYSTDLTDTQWKLFEEFFTVIKGKNLQQHNKRNLINAYYTATKQATNGDYYQKIFQTTPPYGHFTDAPSKKASGKKQWTKWFKKYVLMQIAHQNQAMD